MARQVVEATCDTAGLTQGSSVLEVGAGSGAFTLAWEERTRFVALDISHGLLLANPAARKVESDAFHLPFASDSFDLVFAGAILHHLTDVVGSLREMSRVSRRFVAAIEPNRNNPALAAFGLLVPEERGLLPFTSRWLSHQALRAGLTVDISTPFGWISPNNTPGILLPLLQRLPLGHPLCLNILLVARKTQPKSLERHPARAAEI